ncbi:hypothetical protein BgiBS90_008571, partial [Biomphalaria glabrata]
KFEVRFWRGERLGESGEGMENDDRELTLNVFISNFTLAGVLVEESLWLDEAFRTGDLA